MGCVPLIAVTHQPLLIAGELRLPCALGRGGFSDEKREGDGCTPVGRFTLRECFYRPDRVPEPRTGLPLTAITPQLGWCDDPAHADYNRRVPLPFAASHETLWREDHCYDYLVVIGYNDAPPLPGKGSAIFLHLRHDDGRPTAGCIAVSLADMQRLLPLLGPETEISLGETR